MGTMKFTRSLAILGAAALGLGACSVEVTPGLPGQDSPTPGGETTAGVPGGGSSEDPIQDPTEYPTEADPDGPTATDVPEGFPALTAADGTSIAYRALLSDLDAIEAALDSTVVAEFPVAPEYLDGAVGCGGDVTLVAHANGVSTVHWPMTWEGENPAPLEGFMPGTPGVAVVPGLVAGLISYDATEQWEVDVRDAGGQRLTTNSDKYPTHAPVSVKLVGEDLWVLLMDEGEELVARLPMRGAPEEYGARTEIGAADSGVLAVTDWWSNPAFAQDEFEIHHLGGGSADLVLSGFGGQSGTGVVGLAGSGDVVALVLQQGQGGYPRLVVVDGGTALGVLAARPVGSPTVSGRYVAWQEAAPEDGYAPGPQYLLDLDTETISLLGQGIPTGSLPAMCEGTIAWSTSDGEGAEVLTATLP